MRRDKAEKIMLAILVVGALVLAYWITGGDVPEQLAR